MLDLAALETLDRALASPVAAGALPPHPRDISRQKMDKAQAGVCPFSGRGAA
jgi:hypothetical protein